MQTIKHSLPLRASVRENFQVAFCQVSELTYAVNQPQAIVNAQADENIQITSHRPFALCC